MADKIIHGGFCNNCGGWHDALDMAHRCPACHIARDKALENLREVAGMYCERLPAEVVEALHAIPSKEHAHEH
jgi:NMD protein affecting ribosome stability and mRNA decay